MSTTSSKAKFESSVSTQHVDKFVEASFNKMRAKLQRRGQGWRKVGGHVA